MYRITDAYTSQSDRLLGYVASGLCKEIVFAV